MKLTIIPDDGLVSVDGAIKAIPLDLSNCGIPEDVHALQWFNTKGWIEFDDPVDPFASKPLNEIIEVLPQWALNSVSIWEAWTPPIPVPATPASNQPTTTGTQTL